MSKRQMWGIAAVVVTVVAIGAIVGWQMLSPAGPSKRPPNVILISIDTCRADHLGCYGSDKGLTPNIDAFAETATLFRNAVSPIPLTLPSHTSMLTGKIPLVHGTHGNGLRISSDLVTLPEILQQRGYATGAILSGIVLDRKHGLNQGFEVYNDRLWEAGEYRAERHAETTSQVANKWLQQQVGRQPFFLFLHYFDPHESYHAPGGYAERFGPDSSDQYAAEIAYTDHWIGTVLDRLKQLDLYESSLIIITADHGEMLGEHGEVDHAFFVYESAIKVPLIVKLPGQQDPLRMDEVVGLVDITPTVCAAVGAEPPQGIQGRDVGPLLRGETAGDPTRNLYVESLRPLIFYNAHPLSGLVGRRWKYIHSARSELYDLSVDPGETTNLIETEPGQALLMEQKLRAMFSDLADQATQADQADLDARSQELLASLGYLSAGRRVEMVFETDGDDAKDLIDLHNLFTRDLLDLRRDHQDAEALALCRELIERRPQATQCHAVLANILDTAKRYEEAAEHYTRCIELDPNDAMIYVARGVVYVKLARMDEALADFHEALELDPNDVNAYREMAITHWILGDYEKAAEAYHALLRIHPENVQALISLSALYVDNLDSPEQAEPLAKKAYDLAPGSPRSQQNYGWVIAHLGRYQDATKFLRAAVTESPTAIAHYRLGWTLQRQGMTDQAKQAYRQSLELLDDPSHPFYAKVADALRQVEGS